MRLVSRSAFLLFGGVSLFLLSSCGNREPLSASIPSQLAKPIPIQQVAPNAYRIPKNAFEGTYVFLKTITDVKYPGKDNSSLPSGLYLKSNNLIQFVFTEKRLDVMAVNPLFQNERDAEKNKRLASFPIRHVDIVRKHDNRGIDLGEEEESENYRAWQDREYIIFKVSQDAEDEFSKETRIAEAGGNVEIIPTQGSINFDVSRELNDDTQITERYSFLKFTANPGYAQREYPIDLQKKFGFFKTTTYGFDKYGRITQSQTKEYLNRWDISHPIIYYLSKECPAWAKDKAAEIVKNWNAAFKDATGKTPLVLQEATTQTLGDLRYNFIHCDSSTFAGHGILGYGPQVSNPRTGEIIKADVNIYLGVLNHALFNERIISDYLGKENEPKPVSGPQNDLLHFPKATPLNEPLLSYIDKNLQVSPTLEQIRTALISDQKKQITRLSDGVMETLHDAVTNAKLTDTEIAERIFVTTITHELGHNLGLRHNFKASADKLHFDPGAHESSVMDYGFRTAEEAFKPGPYDRAAIRLAYGEDSPQALQAILSQNYYFCTDDGIFSARDALCNQFDSGTTLTEAAESGLNHYFTMYPFSNVRFDLVNFNASVTSYANRIAVRLYPLRLIYDNATAIIDAAKARSLDRLWYVTGNRIEADSSSEADQIKTIKVSAGSNVEVADGKVTVSPQFVERAIDLAKIGPVLADAFEAQRKATVALLSVVLDQSRGESDTRSRLTGELQTRGILPDKLVALTLLATPLSEPASGEAISPFLGAKDAVGNLLVSLISNTLPASGSKSDRRVLHIYDTSLRELALKLFAANKSSPGIGRHIADTLMLSPVNIKDDSTDALAFKKIETYRKSIRDLSAQLIAGQNLTEDQLNKVREKIVELEEKRDEDIRVAYFAERGDSYMRADVTVEGVGFDGASGLLVRDNINRIEDRIASLKVVESTLIDQAGDDAEKQKTAQQTVESLRELESTLNDYLFGEKQLAMKMARIITSP